MKLQRAVVELRVPIETTQLHCPECGAAFGGLHQYGLTPRELDIADLVMRAYANCEIAGKLGISEDTVKRHMVNIFPKLRVGGRGELMILGMLGREGLKQMREGSAIS